MANRLIPPFFQFLDDNGNPRVGAQLFFYAAGTSTKLSTYNDDDLLTANANPMVLNANGQPSTSSSGSAIDVFGSNAAYSIVLAPSTDTDPPVAAIQTVDPVYASDYSTEAKVPSINGSPNGARAGTAGSVGVLADLVWDFTNRIYYVCTTTGTAVTAVWTAINSDTATDVVTEPQGRLTLTSGLPVTINNVTAAAAVYYTPMTGNLVPIYNGTRFVASTFAELTLTLVASHAAATLYDVFIFNNSGVVTVGSGPAWTSATGRGTGAGTTELTRLSGFLVNNVSITLRNGSTTYSVAANQATYLGTFRTNASNGETDDSSANRLLFNYYNRSTRFMLRNEATATWTYSTATFRQANGSTSNQVTLVQGVQEDAVHIRIVGNVANSTSSIRPVNVGFGLDSTTVNSANITHRSDCTDTRWGLPAAEYTGVVGLGYHVLAWLERGAGTDTQTWSGNDGGTLNVTGITGSMNG